MNKRISRIITVAMSGILSISLLAGCSSSSSSGSSSDGSSSSSEPVELELFSSKSENVDILTELAEKFNETHDNITVTITAPSDAGTVLKTRMAKGDMPDILAIGGDTNYTEVQSAGMLVDLSDEDYVSDLQESYIQMIYDVNADKEEVLYGIPYATNASGVMYNVDKFEEYGLEIPTTWEEFIEICETLQAAGETPLLMTYKDAWTALCPWNSMAPELQPDNFYDDRDAGLTTFVGTHEEIVEKYLQLLEYAQDDFMGLSYDDGNKAFANGEAVMIINGNWAINQYRNANEDFNVNMFALPGSSNAEDNAVTSGVDVLLAICNDTEYLDECKEFIEFMLEEENAQAYIDDQFAFSAVKGVSQGDEAVAGVVEDIENGNVVNFPDHYYPSAFDLSALVSELCLNYTNGMDNDENIAQFLEQCDTKYDSANVD